MEFGIFFSPRIRLDRGERNHTLSDQATPAPSGRETILILTTSVGSVREIQETLRRVGYPVEVSVLENLESELSADLQIVLLAASELDLRTQHVCRAIKQKKPDLPVMVIGPDTWPAKLRFFALGADEYLLWSVDRVELLARIRSLIRKKRLFLYG